MHPVPPDRIDPAPPPPVRRWITLARWRGYLALHLLPDHIIGTIPVLLAFAGVLGFAGAGLGSLADRTEGGLYTGFLLGCGLYVWGVAAACRARIREYMDAFAAAASEAPSIEAAARAILERPAFANVRGDAEMERRVLDLARALRPDLATAGPADRAGA